METVKNITKGVSEKIEDIGQVTQSPLFMQIASFFMRKKRKTKPRADPE